MITDNPLLKKLLSQSEDQLGKLAAQLVGNPAFVSALQKAVSSAIEAKGFLDRQVGGALQSMQVPTTQDMQKLNDRLDELERIFEGLSAKVDVIATRLDEQK
jgi:polyhydroxyalkanoate synthesis regulator phasin